jgi:hypothetical protein
MKTVAQNCHIASFANNGPKTQRPKHPSGQNRQKTNTKREREIQIKLSCLMIKFLNNIDMFTTDNL